ncbi:ArsA family ATPase [Salinibaculum rarum]|uniref:ArsA family ATPase n=1 Tax=Salinibaculum rarum TaxID=3058903 RepID=UPI00265EC423|nr:ArsA family ATPase [Salinibaculum sp. KK48]
MPSVILYGGKGGVGKTTCAGATGWGSAEAGHETLVVSTDPAHSLGDVFETTVTSTPTTVRSGLDAVEVDPGEGTAQYEALFEALADDLGGAGIDLDDAGLRDLFRSGLVPGSDQLAALSTLDTYSDDDDRYDRVIFDTAPTGHTLRLLDLPEAVGTGVETALSVREQVSRKTDAAKTMLFGPYAAMGDDDDDRAFTDLLGEMERVATLLRDPAQTEFRVVCLPERLVLAETERLVEQLRDADVPVGRLVVNRVLDDIDEDCARCTAQRAEQKRVLEDIEATFEQLDIVDLPDLTGETSGTAILDELAPFLTGE